MARRPVLTVATGAQVMAVPLAAYIFVAGALSKMEGNPLWPHWAVAFPLGLMLVTAMLTFIPIVEHKSEPPDRKSERIGIDSVRSKGSIIRPRIRGMDKGIRQEDSQHDIEDADIA